MARIAVVGRPRDGRRHLYLRISHKEDTKYLSLGLSVKEADWNARKGQVRRSHPEHARLNRLIADTQARAEAVLTEMLTTGRLVTVETLRDEIARAIARTEDDGEDFFAFAERVLERYRREGRYGTFKTYRTTVAQLREFLEQRRRWRRLPWGEITVSLVRDFQAWLAETGRAPNTVWKRVTSFRTLLYQAIREGRFPQEKNPFWHISVRKVKGERPRLTYEQIKQLEALELDPKYLRHHVRNWFVFAFYAGGMRFSDVALLRWKHLRRERDGWRLAYRMKKTKEVASLLLPPQAVRILEEYLPEGAPDPEAFVFPILKERPATSEEEFEAIGRANALVNKYLAKLARQIGVPKLTFHMARHSVADHLRRQGVGVYEISKFLGHANLNVTERYLKGFDEEALDRTVRQVFGGEG